MSSWQKNQIELNNISNENIDIRHIYVKNKICLLGHFGIGDMII